MQLIKQKTVRSPQYSFVILLIAMFHILLSDKIGAQKISINLNKVPPPSYPSTNILSLEQRKLLVSAVETLLNEYQAAGKLIDPTKRVVENKSIEQFKNLFNFNALIVNDIEEFPSSTLISPESYARSVYNKLNSSGVHLRINNATLLEIKDDMAGFYIVKVEINKSVFNYISEKYGEKTLPGGRVFTQIFTFDVIKENITQIKISKIEKSCRNRGDCPGPAEEQTTFIGLTLSGIYPIVNSTPSAYFLQNHPEATINVEGEKGISIGFEWTKNFLNRRKSPNKKLYFTLGLAYTMLDVTTKMQNFSLPYFSANAVGDNGILNYMRKLDNSNQEESLRLQQISLPIGLGYRLIKKTRNELILFARIIPSYVISRTGKITGTGDYDAYIAESSWRMLEQGASNPNDWNDMNKLGPFQGGIGVVTDNNQIFDGNKLMWTIMISPVYYFELVNDNPTWSFLVGFDLGYSFSDLVSHNVQNKQILQFSNQTNPGLAQQFLDKSPQLITGLRLGIQRTIRAKM